MKQYYKRTTHFLTQNYFYWRHATPQPVVVMTSPPARPPSFRLNVRLLQQLCLMIPVPLKLTPVFTNNRGIYNIVQSAQRFAVDKTLT
jgi:hypothetical protein